MARGHSQRELATCTVTLFYTFFLGATTWTTQYLRKGIVHLKVSDTFHFP